MGSVGCNFVAGSVGCICIAGSVGCKCTLHSVEQGPSNSGLERHQFIPHSFFIRPSR